MYINCAYDFHRSLRPIKDITYIYIYIYIYMYVCISRNQFCWRNFLNHYIYKGLRNAIYIYLQANWIGHILRRNCLLQRVIKGKIKGRIEVTGRRGRRRRKLLDDLTERRGYSHLKEETLDRTMWRARFGREFGPVVRQTTEWINIYIYIYIYIYIMF